MKLVQARPWGYEPQGRRFDPAPRYQWINNLHLLRNWALGVPTPSASVKMLSPQELSGLRITATLPQIEHSQIKSLKVLHTPSTFILFGSYLPAETKKKKELARIGGEAATYHPLALWRSVQLEELRKN